MIGNRDRDRKFDWMEDFIIPVVGVLLFVFLFSVATGLMKCVGC